MRQREFHQGVAAVEVEFLADVGAVCFDRAVADAEFVGDLAAGFVVGDELEDAPFGGRQIVERGFLLPQVGGALAAVDE